MLVMKIKPYTGIMTRVQDSTFGMLLPFLRIPATETTRKAVKAS